MNKKMSKLEDTFLYISSLFLASTFIAFIYAFMNLTIETVNQHVLAFLFLLMIIVVAIVVVKKIDGNTSKLRLLRFIYLIIYLTAFTFFMGFAFSGALLQFLQYINLIPNDTVMLIITTGVTTALYLAAIYIRRDDEQHLKDSKVAVFIVNAILLVLFEIVVVYKLDEYAIKLHIYAFPTFIASLICLGVLEYRFSTVKKDQSQNTPTAL
ncbi:hypothetical protein BRE01_62640 [Brevibacillus reuszeri]|uniref:Uncharacterized protein n=1 Tax=Brevibacillus reuszeri TaxID=54915 RepID=A0A0K9YW41_9BACL|nr:hypothetical protein [Brevibacillus reuszeri]KNB72949.1 hypothetical protein ADS79_14085 [Brevibacillus reuszeri]GED72562.1 hypothetical protein BRE01_62640 [Brevibacillus reuszeri]